MKSKDFAVETWLEPIVEKLTGEQIRFNFSDDTPEGVAVLTNYSDRAIKRYLHTGAIKAYGFTVLWTKAYSTDDDDLNLEANQFVDKFMDTVEALNYAGPEALPEFPDNCTVQRVEILQDQPALDGVNAQHGLARYRVAGRVIYFESYNGGPLNG